MKNEPRARIKLGVSVRADKTCAMIDGARDLAADPLETRRAVRDAETYEQELTVPSPAYIPRLAL